MKYEDVLREMELRDGNDRNRAVAPAVPAPDAVFFDNSGMTVEEGVEGILAIMREKIPALSL